MIFLYILVAVGLLCIGTTITLKIFGPAPKAPLSEPAKKIMALYNKVPEASRPYGDLRMMLEALDLKNDIKKVNEHYSRTYRDYSDYRLKTSFSWSAPGCGENHSKWCSLKEYAEIRNALEDLIKAHERQQKALEVAGVQGSLDLIEQFTKQAREERKILDSVTKELER